MSPCGSINELTDDTHSVGYFSYTTLQHIADAQFATNLIDVDGPALVRER